MGVIMKSQWSSKSKPEEMYYNYVQRIEPLCVMLCDMVMGVQGSIRSPAHLML